MNADVLDLKERLKYFFGFDNFKGNQEEVIKSIMNGDDCFVIMPTGAGKSLCYQLPALIKDGTAIIISPLIALMKNQVDLIRGFGDNDSVAHFLNSSLTKTDSLKVKNDVAEGKTKLLYVAPETLKKDETIEFLRSIEVSFVAVDEAHCISEWGHDFRPEYRRIKQIIKSIDDVPIVALTATATPKVQSDIQKNLNMSNAIVYKSSFNRSNLYYEVKQKGKKDKTLKEIINLINNRKGKSIIIYCLSRKKVEEIASILVANNIKALPYHAGLDAKTRVFNQDAFLMEDVDVIVATIAFGMGIDKPDVRCVIHYDVPKSLEGYYQETGRAGRDGLDGDCILFYNPADTEKLEKFMKDKPVAEREIGSQLIFEMSSFAESSQCRRKLLLHYFGEDFDEENCNKMCDNCRHPKSMQDVTSELADILQAVSETAGKVNQEHIIDLVRGEKTDDIKAYKHDELESFGVGSDRDVNFWKSVIRLALLENYISKNIENYGLLSITATGKKYLEKPKPHKLAIDKEFTKVSDEDFEQVEIENVYDEELFARLKEIQKQVAKEKKLPPYVIFQETALEEMATKYPITMSEFENIQGVGKNKAQKFGAPFIRAIADYVEENDIERPQDMVLKTVANRSGRKIQIIKNIDKKADLEDMCESLGITFDELLVELENIVYSGTKINFKYFIDELMDEQTQEDVYNHFRNTQNDDIDAAVKEFNGDFSHEELGLMRIQFISDVAN
ncbi:MAG: DNA helicase RecQ [Flavobacteriales bacterium]|nr:DNA helicase RecQ [Flavobacteriales bacterium]